MASLTLMTLPLLLAAVPVGLPPWWTSFQNQELLESPFVQTSQSAVFGQIERRGRLWLAKGGRLRVEYTDGLLLVCDGRTLMHYDPTTRTAQRFVLGKATADMPLLSLLADPGSLQAHYTLEARSGAVWLRPRRPGVPEAEAKGRGGCLTSVSWLDLTGARQTLTFSRLLRPAKIPPDTFTWKAPAGARFIE